MITTTRPQIADAGVRTTDTLPVKTDNWQHAGNRRVEPQPGCDVYLGDLESARRTLDPLYLLYSHYLSCQIVQPANLT